MRKKTDISMSLPFYDPLWSFFGQYINIFHKIELQTIILMRLTCLNLIWINSYNIKHIFFSFPVLYNFVKKYTENL